MTTLKKRVQNSTQWKNRGEIFALFILSTALIILSISCRKFIEASPPSIGLSSGNVYTSDETATAVLTDIFAAMSQANTTLTDGHIGSISVYISLAADELNLHQLNERDLLDYYRNDLKQSSLISYWKAIYPQIFSVNNALEGLTATTSLTAAVKQQLLGEARFVRAFCYFYLVNMYGDVPLVLNIDYKTNALLPRASAAAVYQQIINDLKEAQKLLSANYLKGDVLTAYSSGEEERVRPTAWAATALLARVYLYTGDYMNAELAATAIINQTSLYSLTSLNEVFLKNSKEAIWQLQPVGIDEQANTGEGRLFVLPPDGPGANNPVYFNNKLQESFEMGDLRKSSWIDSVISGSTVYYYPYKYKIGNVAAPTEEYPTILRLAEQYLIRAEARASKNDITGAQNDLNMIRSRAGLDATSAADKAALLNAILEERRRELFTEWGHRWFDLKRTNRLHEVMNLVTPSKGGIWSPHKALLPIPEEDITRNPNMVQNPGYN